MHALKHFIVGLVGAIVLFPFFDWMSILFLVTTFGMDIDHVLLYYKAKKKISFKGTYELSKNYHAETTMLPFHTIEITAVLFILSFFSDIFYVAFLGIMVHFIMDTFDMPFTFFKKFSRYPSLIFWQLQNGFDKKIRERIKKYGICQFPGCTFDQIDILELHIVDQKYDLILCPNHHKMVDNMIIPIEEVRNWLKVKKRYYNLKRSEHV